MQLLLEVQPPYCALAFRSRLMLPKTDQNITANVTETPRVSSLLAVNTQ